MKSLIIAPLNYYIFTVWLLLLLITLSLSSVGRSPVWLIMAFLGNCLDDCGDLKRVSSISWLQTTKVIFLFVACQWLLLFWDKLLIKSNCCWCNPCSLHPSLQLLIVWTSTDSSPVAPSQVASMQGVQCWAVGSQSTLVLFFLVSVTIVLCLMRSASAM